jgi:hypothetical protein
LTLFCSQSKVTLQMLTQKQIVRIALAMDPHF